MRRPKEVDICGISFRIEVRTSDEDPLLEDCYGYTDCQESLIVIEEGLDEGLFRNVLLHEIQHAIWEHSGIKAVKGEEAFILVFTPHLLAALRSIRWLTI